MLRRTCVGYNYYYVLEVLKMFCLLHDLGISGGSRFWWAIDVNGEWFLIEEAA